LDLNALLALMAKKEASDLFITAGKRVAMKCDGQIMDISESELTVEQSLAAVLSLMDDRQKAEFEQTKECQFAYSMPEVCRFRVSAFVQRGAAGMVLRRIQSHIPSYQELNLPPILTDLIMFKRGLVIFVGGTGAGKSSSLASLIRFRNENTTGHIITIEDPIEFLHPHLGCIVTQREIGLDTESYQVALKNVLRQAPDVILIGEVRDREAMQHALAFAETGHLCVCTLHANNANQALDRILHFFPEDAHRQLFMDLSLNLRGIVAQQLLSRTDGDGRYPVLEILLNTPLATELIRKGEVFKLKDLMKNSGDYGMQTFDQALYQLYAAGKINYEDAINFADSQNEVRLMIKLAADGNDFVGQSMQLTDKY